MCLILCLKVVFDLNNVLTETREDVIVFGVVGEVTEERVDFGVDEGGETLF
jgi:hypothetical protein